MGTGPIDPPRKPAWALDDLGPQPSQALVTLVHFMQVSKWLGHSTFTLTLDVYGDFIPEEDGGAVNNLPEPPAWRSKLNYRTTW
jgi:hypothetical protein